MTNIKKTLVFGNSAPTLHDKGYLPLPLNGKKPFIVGWSKRKISDEVVNDWANRYTGKNVGIRADSAQAVDIDIYDESVVND